MPVRRAAWGTLCAAMFLAPVATAATKWPSNLLHGNITGDVLVTKASPGPVYTVNSDLLVQATGHMVIEPGVTLKFTARTDPGFADFPYVDFIVRGSLEAIGSPLDSIKFVSSNLGTDDWGGVSVEGSGSMHIEYASIRGALDGMLAYAQGSGTRILRHISIARCSELGMLATTPGLVFDDIAISGVGTGVGLEIGPLVTRSFTDSLAPLPCLVEGWAIGVQVEQGAVARNIISWQNGVGFQNEDPSGVFHYCTAVNNTGWGFTGSGMMLDCVATGNGAGGFHVLAGNALYCDAFGNGGPAYLGEPGATIGPNCGAADPAFVDPPHGDFTTPPSSPVKTSSNSAGELGGFGPGPGGATPAHPQTWGEVKARYR